MRKKKHDEQGGKNRTTTIPTPHVPSHPASTMALPASGFLARASATAYTVTGRFFSVKRRCRRQKPAREPYSYNDSMLACRTPGKAAAPTISESRCSDWVSPFRMQFSPPSS